MTNPRELRVLFFDTFGTCVAQRKPVADELWQAAQAALRSDTSAMNKDVRAKTMAMSYEEWFEFGGEWNTEGSKFVKHNIDTYGAVDWRAVDEQRIQLLPKLLKQRGLIIPRENDSGSDLQVAEGSLWNEIQLQQLGRVWHQLTPWPDTCHGLDLLNKHFITISLSNTYNELLENLMAHSKIPFKHIYSSDMFRSFKPDPKVCLGAAEKIGAKPEECGLVAAHLYDLKAAKACGFYTIYVDRPLEEKNPELREENIPNVWIDGSEGGFVAVAEHLGVQVD